MNATTTERAPEPEGAGRQPEAAGPADRRSAAGCSRARPGTGACGLWTGTSRPGAGPARQPSGPAAALPHSSPPRVTVLTPSVWLMSLEMTRAAPSSREVCRCACFQSWRYAWGPRPRCRELPPPRTPAVRARRWCALSSSGGRRRGVASRPVEAGCPIFASRSPAACPDPARACRGPRRSQRGRPGCRRDHAEPHAPGSRAAAAPRAPPPGSRACFWIGQGADGLLKRGDRERTALQRRC